NQVVFWAPVSGTCPRDTVTSGTYCALRDVTATLTYSSTTSTYTFTTHPYASYTFNSSGQLTGESSVGGASLSLTYNSPAPGSGACPGTAASCTTITSASGRKLVLAKNGSGLIVEVVDPLSRAWTYAYCVLPSSTCSSGDLVSVTDPLGNVTSYTYDKSNSNAALTHDLLTITNPNGQTGGPNAGAKLVNTYNGSGEISTETDPNGNQTSFDYSHLDAS